MAVLLPLCLALWAASVRPLAAQPNSSSVGLQPAVSTNSTCNNFRSQVNAMCTFYHFFNGPHWFVQSGWSNCDQSPALTIDNATTGVCQTNLTENVYSPGAVFDPVGPQLITLPDVCCWRGITCCMVSYCPPLGNNILCNCTVGTIVGIALENNNLTGSFALSTMTPDEKDELNQVACSLRTLALQNNRLSGSIPPTITALSNLWSLALGYNQLTGRVPQTIGSMASLRVFELSNNKINGSIPVGLCGSAYYNANSVSPITDLLLANNLLTGTLDITFCQSLIQLDVSNNKFTNVQANITYYPSFHILLLGSNQFTSRDMRLNLSSARLLSEYSLEYNNMTGTIPDNIKDLFYLTSLRLAHNAFTGTLPTFFFANLGTLTSLDLSVNRLQGSLPDSLGMASSLIQLSVADNSFTGTIPETLRQFRFNVKSSLDTRGTYMSCCGEDFVLYPNGTGRYKTINYSKPLLPSGLMFSPIMRPVVSKVTSSSANINCPFIAINPAEAVIYGEGNQTPVTTLFSWYLNPGYTLFHGCECDMGYTLVVDNYAQQAYCQANPAAALPWVEQYFWVIIIATVVVAVLLSALFWYVVYNRGSRPVLLQNLLDMRKRLKGPATSGVASIVVTDIQGFSDLMKESPELTTKALQIHNQLIRKAQWANFGTTIEQEGDSYSIVFHEAADAIKFCLQAQLLLAQAVYPSGLFGPRQNSSRQNRPDKRLVSGGSSLRSIWKRSKVKLASSVLARSPISEHPRSGTGDSVRVHVEHSRQSLGKQSAKQLASRSGSLRAGRSSTASPRANSSSGVGTGPSVHTSTQPQQQPQQLQQQQQQQQRPHFRVSSATLELPGPESPIPGLRVRMGVATGEIDAESGVTGGAVLQVAKVVSDAAAGGQVLMCSSTFQAVRHLAQELGCVDVNGTNYAKLQGVRSGWLTFWRHREQQQEEATLLHMGEYVRGGKGASSLPQILTPQFLNLDARSDSAQWRNAVASFSGTNTASGRRAVSRRDRGWLQLYQVLAPSLVPRGRFFCSTLALKDEWAPVDAPYFSAPGALSAPVAATDTFPSHLSVTMVTIVFCMVEGGKQYAAKSRRDAREVHVQLVALLRSVLLQVPGGYYVKGQDGDFKYMLAFADPKDAMAWCIAVQECALYVDWPLSALRQWPEERGTGGELLFRGPRLKMGVCEGPPRSIQPDYNGRADYLGDSVNQAARFMDAAAHGGQVACKQELVEHILRWLPPSSTRNVPSPPSGRGFEPDTAAWRRPGAPVASGPGRPGSPVIDAGEVDVRQLETWHEEGGHSVDGAGGAGQPRDGSAAGGVGGPVVAGRGEQQQQQHQGGQLEAHSSLQQQQGHERLRQQQSSTGQQPLQEQQSQQGQQSGQQLQWQQQQPSQPPERKGGVNGAVAVAMELAARVVPSSLGQEQHRFPAFDAGHLAQFLADNEKLGPSFGAPTEVQVVRLGLFRFKGSDEVIPMVRVTQAALAGRRFPSEPPKGKGARLAEASGVAVSAIVPVLDIIRAYTRPIGEGGVGGHGASTPVDTPRGSGAAAGNSALLRKSLALPKWRLGSLHRLVVRRGSEEELGVAMGEQGAPPPVPG